jgi:hypothetical protein
MVSREIELKLFNNNEYSTDKNNIIQEKTNQSYTYFTFILKSMGRSTMFEKEKENSLVYALNRLKI